MADATGEVTVATLLRLLPPDAAELVLGRLPAEAGARIRARLADPVPPPDREVEVALAEFFDLLRIADRVVPAAGAPGPAPPVPAAPAGPVDELRALPPDRLARALEGESPATMALILGCLEPSAAGQVMRRLPADRRADVALRLTRPAARNPALVNRLARAVADKGRRLADLPTPPSDADRAMAMADMIRALPRADRPALLKKLEAADPTFAGAVQDQVYRVEDILRIPDRQLQTLLSELEVKKLALALHGADPAVRDKVTANMSTRARAALAEEMELLGNILPSAVREARSEFLTVVRRLEDEGRITIDE